MRIMVFDVPAESGGALSVLYDFYNEVSKDSRNYIEWIFVVSKPELTSTEKIKVLRYPWIKKSWFHRLYFDNFIAPKLVTVYEADKIFSLQNIVIPKVNIEQILYVHNSLPFIEHKFSLFSNTLLWVYQNIISRTITNSIKKANIVVAQTYWMKDAFIKKCNIDADKVLVIPPEIKIDIREKFDIEKLKLPVSFFYPASAVEFKNHKLIVEACKKLSEERLDYKVIFTINGDENSYSNRLKEEIEKYKLNIELRGMLSREEVFDRYRDTVLVFPSYVESSPLPLTECLLHEGIIFASNTNFSREILKNYENSYYFDAFDQTELYELMKMAICNKIMYKEISSVNIKSNDQIKLLDIVCK